MSYDRLEFLSSEVKGRSQVDLGGHMMKTAVSMIAVLPVSWLVADMFKVEELIPIGIFSMACFLVLVMSLFLAAFGTYVRKQGFEMLIEVERSAARLSRARDYSRAP